MLNGCRMREQVQRTRGRADLAGGNPQVFGGGRQTAMAEQKLDGPDVGTGFQQMNGESVAKRMGCNRFTDARELARFLTGLFDRTSVDRLSGHIALEEPLLRPHGPPVTA